MQIKKIKSSYFILTCTTLQKRSKHWSGTHFPAMHCFPNQLQLLLALSNECVAVKCPRNITFDIKYSEYSFSLNKNYKFKNKHLYTIKRLYRCFPIMVTYSTLRFTRECQLQNPQNEITNLFKVWCWHELPPSIAI